METPEAGLSLDAFKSRVLQLGLRIPEGRDRDVQDALALVGACAQRVRRRLDSLREPAHTFRAGTLES